jgi:hypothetical protein
VRFYRRNATDARFRALERRYRAGDTDAFVPYVMALRAKGEWRLAAGVVRAAMIATGEWHPWPTFNHEIASFEGAFNENENNFRLATEFGEPLAAPMLGVEHEKDGDWATTWFADGPYIVTVDPFDPEYINRQFDLGQAPPGKRAFIPLWRVLEVHPPPLGIPQKGYDVVSAGYGPGFQGTIRLGEGDVVHVDGPVVAELLSRTWNVENGEFLCTSLARRIAEIGPGASLGSLR